MDTSVFMRMDGAPNRRVAINILLKSNLFSNFDRKQLREFAVISKLRHLSTSETLLKEGEADSNLYIVGYGRLDVHKQTDDGTSKLSLAQLSSGAAVGELKLFGNYTNSATVTAIEPTTLVVIPLKTLEEIPELSAQRATLNHAAGQVLSRRLRHASSTAANALQAELDQAKARVFGGRMLLFIVALMAGNSLLVAGLNTLSPESLPPPTVLSFLMILTGAAFVAMALRRSPFSLRTLGLTLENAGSNTLQGILVTIPILIALTAGKWAIMDATTLYAGRSLFDPSAISRNGNFDVALYFSSLLGYCLHVPIQEFVVRCGLQAALQRLLDLPDRYPNFLPIVISNLMFAAFHTHLGIKFAIAAFVPALLWGWLYGRQQSIVGPVVSHILLGFWAIFVLGLHYGMNG